jgi:hypothetical protein
MASKDFAVGSFKDVKPGAVTHKPKYERIERAPEHQRMQIGRGIKPNLEKLKSGCGAIVSGLGMAPQQAADITKEMKAGLGGTAGLGSIIDLINNSKDNPVYNMDVIEQVRWTMAGPQTDQSITANFGAEIDLFGSGRSVQGIDFVETTMAQTGQTQTYFIACALGFHVEPEPLTFDTIGNAWQTPTGSPSVVPASPDIWTLGDITELGFAGGEAPGPFAGQAYARAVWQHGWWANYAAWHLVRAYNLRWKIGQHTNIMDEVLRHTAYMPPSAQEGSASSSEVDIIDFVNQMNERYVTLGSGAIFLPVNFLRLGSNGPLVAGSAPGIFTPTSDFERVGATFGGMDLRSMLRGNSEFRKLTLPYVIKPGVPIGLILQENDTVQADQMRRALSMTLGTGIIPPLETPFSKIPLSAVTSPLTERTADGLLAAQSVPLETAIFKDGDLKLSLMIRGFEVTEDWYNIMSQNADVRDVVMAACGVRFALQGA